MKADKENRRNFMKSAALIAGTAAEAMRSAAAQSTRKGEKEIPIPGPAYVIPPYGERSRFVTSVRGRIRAAAGFYRDHHSIRIALHR